MHNYCARLLSPACVMGLKHLPKLAVIALHLDFETTRVAVNVLQYRSDGPGLTAIRALDSKTTNPACVRCDTTPPEMADPNLRRIHRSKKLTLFHCHLLYASYCSVPTTRSWQRSCSLNLQS